jgi:hypothetical protein
MNRIPRFPAAIAILALGCCACASQQTVVVWEKPGATCDEVDAARQACSDEMASTEVRGVHRDRLEAEATGTRFVECMRERGFTGRTETVDCRASEDGGAPDS